MPYRKLDKFPRSDAKCTVYLLHFTRPLGHAQHYIGVVRSRQSLDERIKDHRTGRGANICRLAIESGAQLLLVRLWEDVPRYTELKLKNRGGAKMLCPICKELRYEEISTQASAVQPST